MKKVFVTKQSNKWTGFRWAVPSLVVTRKPIEDYERLKLIVEDFTKTKTKEELFRNALERGLLIAPGHHA